MNTTLHPFLAEGLDPQALLLIGLVLVLGSLLWHRARTRTGNTRGSRARPETRTSRHAAMHNSRLGIRATEDIQELMIRLEELSREICGQIDTRFAKLEHVIVEAEQKLAALSAALRAPAESPGTAPCEPRPRAPAPSRRGRGRRPPRPMTGTGGSAGWPRPAGRTWRSRVSWAWTSARWS